MKISEASEKCGLSIDTIRYYEQAGLIPNIKRGSDKHRYFSAENIDWLVLIASLRATDMSMKDMRAFAELYKQGNSAIAERRKLLEKHATQLHQQRVKLDQCEDLLHRKLKIYDQIERV